MYRDNFGERMLWMLSSADLQLDRISSIISNLRVCQTHHSNKEVVLRLDEPLGEYIGDPVISAAES